jgi:hypothetical protein
MDKHTRAIREKINKYFDKNIMDIEFLSEKRRITRLKKAEAILVYIEKTLADK